MVQIRSSDLPDPADDRRDESRSLKRKRQILDAASRVFRRRGLHASGMRDIAAELGMHVGNLYYYFRNKEELLAFCQEDSLSGLLGLARETLEADEPPDRQLRRLIVGHVVLLNEDTPGSLAHLEVEALTGEWREKILAKRETYETVLHEIIQNGVDQSLFQAEDPRLAAMAILGSLNWTVKWFRRDGALSAEEVGHAFADQILSGLSRRETLRGRRTS